MVRYAIQRFLQIISMVILVSFLIFMLIRMIPGDPVATASILLTLIITIPTAIFAATRQNTPADYLARPFSLLGVCMPSFWPALLLILFFIICLGWFPALGYVSPFDNFTGWLRTITMPMLVLSLHGGAKVTRFMRSDILEQLHQDYVRTVTG